MLKHFTKDGKPMTKELKSLLKQVYKHLDSFRPGFTELLNRNLAYITGPEIMKSSFKIKEGQNISPSKQTGESTFINGVPTS